MKLQVPFYKQENKNDCGPTALQMVLEFLGEKHKREELMDLVDSERSGATWTPGLAVAAAELGFKAEFYTKSAGANPENFKLEFYKKETDGLASGEQKLARIRKRGKELGVKMEETTLDLNEILSKISENCVPIVLLDWGKIVGKDSYHGHFVPIVGYDEESVFVHNQGTTNPQEFFSIKKELFDEARKAVGTDEDIAFIYRK